MKIGTLLREANFAARRMAPTFFMLASIGAGAGAIIETRKSAKKEDEALAPTLDAIADGRDKMYSGKDMLGLYVNHGKAVGKLYAKPIIFETISIGCAVASNRILVKRTTALATALATVTTSFSDYRQRVIDDQGAEKDLEYLGKTKEIETTDKNGKTKRTTVIDADKIDDTPFTFVFDWESLNYGSDLYMQSFIRNADDYFNKRLASDKAGVIFGNDIRKHFDVPRCKSDQFSGWLWDESYEDIVGNPDRIDERPIKLSYVRSERFNEEKQKMMPVYIVTMNCKGNVISKVWNTKAAETDKD